MPRKKDSVMNMERRRKYILELLGREGQVRISQLSRELNVTPVTLRSDLTALEEEGFLSRTQGGAVQSVKNYYHLGQRVQMQQYAGEKKAVAECAARLVKDGETLMINSGATTHYLAMALKRWRSNLSVVTNSLAVATELGDHPTFRVILLGGEINAQFGFTYGADALAQIAKYKADRAFLSLDGIHLEAGFTTHQAEEAVLDQRMLERSHQSVIVADCTKYGHESFYQVESLASVDTLITNAAIGEEACGLLRRRGIDVILAE